MSDFETPLVRLVAPKDMPVRIPDWPEAVGIAICRAGGKVISMQPYDLRETGQGLRRRLVQEVGDQMRNFALWPAVKGFPAGQLTPAEDLQLLSELELALRSMPRLVEDVADFAINFEFAVEEGLGLDGLADQQRRRGEEARQPGEQGPTGYLPFVRADPQCEVISGAVLRPAGAGGVDLLLVPEKPGTVRQFQEEAQILVREDSLRVAVPLGPVLVNGKLPPLIRLPAGALMPAQNDGKPVPALVLRRGGYLFVAPDYNAIASPASAAIVTKVRKPLPWLAIGLGLGGLVLAAAVAAALVWFLPSGGAERGTTVPVQGLRDSLFAPVND